MFGIIKNSTANMYKNKKGRIEVKDWKDLTQRPLGKAKMP